MGSLLVAFAVSALGFVLFTFGRKMARAPQLLAGIVLMIYPYFVPGVVWMLAIAAGVTALLWLSLRYGL